VIPDEQDFRRFREEWRVRLAADDSLRRQAVELQIRADAHRYTYLREWCGVPIIRLPDDIVTLQEIIFAERPASIIEVGIARGGGLVLNASIMRMCGLSPNVLGIDIAIHDHTRSAILSSQFSDDIEMWEGDSVSDAARKRVADFIRSADNETSGHLLILDSNHTESHVLQELNVLADLLPAKSIVLVADTLIEEFPAGHYSDREWDVGNNPLTAVNKFLAKDDRFQREELLGQRALISEFRDGILRKIR